ncbi:MAG: hypothetical protein ACLFN7_03780 [Candidatus Acetothermia bacterium]
MLSVLASTRLELEGLGGGLDMESENWSQHELIFTGIGRTGVKDSLDVAELSSELEGMLSVGFAGSIDPEFTTGDLCLVEKIGSEVTEGEYRTDEEFRKRAELVLEEDTRTTGLLTLEEAVTESEDKRALEGEEYPIVDQETYWQARVARDNDIPFLGLRVVFDDIDRTLPPDHCYDNSGVVKPWNLMLWLFRHPKGATELPGAFTDLVRARKRLARAVEAVVPVLLG